MSRRRILTIGAAALASPGWSRAEGVAAIGGPAFGTYWRIVVSESADVAGIRRRISAIIAAVDDTMSPYRPDSEITGFNTAQITSWFPASAEFLLVAQAALRVSRLTAGAFDPTVGPVVNEYGFGPIKGSRIGAWSDLDIGPNAIRKQLPGLTLDFCGIAKGRALDQMASALDAMALDGYLIELGGEVYARKTNPLGRNWRVVIEPPGQQISNARHVVELEDLAIATSSDAINAYVVAGRRYGHIIDPHAVKPVSGGPSAVSVLAKSAMYADALATAIMAMEPAVAVLFAMDHGISALIQLGDGETERTVVTGEFGNYLV